jgi:flagellar assembly factor FliW
MDPHRVKEDYNPTVNEKILSSLGEMSSENTFVLTTVTVPRKVEDFTVNLKAPIIINTENNKAVQIIVEDDYPVKFKVYDILHAKKEKAGE